MKPRVLTKLCFSGKICNISNTFTSSLCTYNFIQTHLNLNNICRMGIGAAISICPSQLPTTHIIIVTSNWWLNVNLPKHLEFEPPNFQLGRWLDAVIWISCPWGTGFDSSLSDLSMGRLSLTLSWRFCWAYAAPHSTQPNERETVING